MPFGPRLPELIVVVVIALLFLGPKRLPEMGSAVGKTIREFQKSMREVVQPPADAAATPPPVAPPAEVQQQIAAPSAVARTEPAPPAAPTTSTPAPAASEPEPAHPVQD